MTVAVVAVDVGTHTRKSRTIGL